MKYIAIIYSYIYAFFCELFALLVKFLDNLVLCVHKMHELLKSITLMYHVL